MTMEPKNMKDRPSGKVLRIFFVPLFSIIGFCGVCLFLHGYTSAKITAPKSSWSLYNAEDSDKDGNEFTGGEL